MNLYRISSSTIVLSALLTLGACGGGSNGGSGTGFDSLLGACRTWESSAANRPQRSIFRRFFDQYLDIGLQNRQKLSSLGPIFAFGDPSPAGS